ncbi:MAG TPA: right-handed parallel beta-helix repeat-containing protein [Rhodopila sp.]|nr:right-handed parallel beta-helix repeat-containing protein [Rhodopila sp.]
MPSEAASKARDGDVVRLDPGTYADCAIWTANRLRIEAAAPGVVLAGKTCAGKGIFITQGRDITIRGITFADATVPDRNGAGIRAEGRNLTVENSRFLRNENGILAGGGADSEVRIIDSEFLDNGACIRACAHGVYAGGPIKRLEILRSLFYGTRIAHHIKSRARTTIVRDSRIEDGPDGTSSYLIDVPNGGNLLIENDVMEKGPQSSNPGVAILIGEEGVTNPTTSLIVRNNTFRNDTGRRTIFVSNRTTTKVEVQGNVLTGNVTELDGPGGPVR